MPIIPDTIPQAKPLRCGGDATHIYIDRGWIDHPFFADDKIMGRNSAWLWLLTHANEEGHAAFSTRALAQKWGWSKSRVDRFLTALVDAKLIERNPPVISIIDTVR